MVRRAVRLAASTRKTFIVNSDWQAALDGGAGGVHLTSDQSVESIVKAVGRDAPDPFLIGASTHSINEGVRAAEQGAHYVFLSPIFPPLSKIGHSPALGLERLAEACDRIKVPVLALGGLGPERLHEVVEAGAWGIAGITWIFEEVSRLRR